MAHVLSHSLQEFVFLGSIPCCTHHWSGTAQLDSSQLLSLGSSQCVTVQLLRGAVGAERGCGSSQTPEQTDTDLSPAGSTMPASLVAAQVGASFGDLPAALRQWPEAAHPHCSVPVVLRIPPVCTALPS